MDACLSDEELAVLTDLLEESSEWMPVGYIPPSAQILLPAPLSRLLSREFLVRLARTAQLSTDRMNQIISIEQSIRAMEVRISERDADDRGSYGERGGY